MNFLIGPILLVRFRLGKHLIYLFGDDHTNIANPKGIYTIDYKKTKSGVIASKVTIERFIYDLYERARKQNAYLNLLFEIIPSIAPFTTDIDDSKLKSRFDRILLLLNVHKFDRIENITLNPVDFRVLGDTEGSGSYQGIALNYFSLFVMLFKDGEYDLIDKIFPINEFEWDIQLLKDTLMDGKFERKEIPDKVKYQKAFEDVKDLNGYVQARYFNDLPHEGLKELIRDLIERKVNSISQDYLAFRKGGEEKETLMQKIAAVHMWFMDIPAFCVLMEKVTPRPGLTVGYYGAEHVTNILPLIARLDPYFTTHVAGCEGLDLPAEIREELMEFV
jgi:hypothetical protein